MRSFLIIIFSFIVVKGFAQDPQFSQFYSAPMALSPAMVGVMDGDFRVAANFRNQWQSVTTPFQTAALSADMGLRTGFSENDYIGLGILLMNDQAGDSELRATQAQLAFAYHKSMNGDDNNYLSIGAQVGAMQYSINYSQLYFDNQFNGIEFDMGTSAGENFENNTFMIMDASAGFGWYYADEYWSLQIGAGAQHLNQPKVSFFEDGTGVLQRKLTAYIGGNLNLGSSLMLMPRAIYVEQGDFEQIALGALIRYEMSDGRSAPPINLYAGALYRVGDAFVPNVRMDYGPVSFGVSYDMTISDLQAVSSARGGIELSLVYMGSLFGERKSYHRTACPKW